MPHYPLVLPKEGTSWLGGKLTDPVEQFKLDTQALPPGLYKTVRDDLARYSEIPITRVALRKHDNSYIGIIDSDGSPYMFVLNSLGMLTRKIEDNDQAWKAFDELMTAERRDGLDRMRNATDREMSQWSDDAMEKALKVTTDIQHEHGTNGVHYTHVAAFSKIKGKKTLVGMSAFSHRGNKLHPESVTVFEEHRRQGVGTTMYHHAAKATGKTIISGDRQTSAGKQFSASVNRKQFKSFIDIDIDIEKAVKIVKQPGKRGGTWTRNAKGNVVYERMLGTLPDHRKRVFDDREHRMRIDTHKFVETAHREYMSDLKDKMVKLQASKKDATPKQHAAIKRKLAKMSVDHAEHKEIADAARRARISAGKELEQARGKHNEAYKKLSAERKAKAQQEKEEKAKRDKAQRVVDEREAIVHIGHGRVAGHDPEPTSDARQNSNINFIVGSGRPRLGEPRDLTALEKLQHKAKMKRDEERKKESEAKHPKKLSPEEYAAQQERFYQEDKAKARKRQEDARAERVRFEAKRPKHEALHIPVKHDKHVQKPGLLARVSTSLRRLFGGGSATQHAAVGKSLYIPMSLVKSRAKPYGHVGYTRRTKTGKIVNVKSKGVKPTASSDVSTHVDTEDDASHIVNAVNPFVRKDDRVAHDAHKHLLKHKPESHEQAKQHLRDFLTKLESDDVEGDTHRLFDHLHAASSFKKSSKRNVASEKQKLLRTLGEHHDPDSLFEMVPSSTTCFGMEVKVPSPKNQLSHAAQKSMRDFFVSTLEGFGIKRTDGNLPGSDKYRLLSASDNRLGAHHWDGQIDVAAMDHYRMITYAKNYMINGNDHAASKRELDAFCTVMHEQLHGCSPPYLDQDTYRFERGRQLEEVTTEVLARHFTNKTFATPEFVALPVVSAQGSYGPEILHCALAIRDATKLEDDEVRKVMVDACIAVKQSRGQRYGSGETRIAQATDVFIDAITKDPAVKAKLRSTLWTWVKPADKEN